MANGDYSAEIRACRIKIANLNGQIRTKRINLNTYNTFDLDMKDVDNKSNTLLDDITTARTIVYDSYNDNGKHIGGDALDVCYNQANQIASTDVPAILQEISRKIEEINEDIRNLTLQRDAVQADLNWYLSR